MTATTKHGYAVGLFDTYGEAEHAMRVLSNSGLSAVDCRCLRRTEAPGPSELDIAAELDRIGVPVDQKSIYQYEFDAGRILMVVEAHDRIDEFETILNDCGAINVNVRDVTEPATEEHQYPFAETEHTTPNKPR